MKLSEFFSTGIMSRKATLNIDIDLDSGESMKKGEEVRILKDYGDGHYHAEHNGFACKVHRSEFTFL